MSKYHSFYDTVDQIVSYGVNKGILHLFTSNQSIAGTSLSINGMPVLNFGSCSYLGLEFDPRLKAAAKDAITHFGTQFSESRAYVSIGLYKELQHLLEKIFDAYCVITPTTTLGHIANIPVMVEEGHAVILDQQVHNSVQTAVQLVKARGIHIELVRHNRMDLLENRIIELRQKHKKIWYMADGIYSMFGDTCPIAEIYAFMDKYPEFHFYVDDAHGMSIHGEHGRGFVLKNRKIHQKMVMATSLNKAFACGGGVLVYAERELARKVGTVGGPLLSSGPMQPSALGAAIASAKIHLSHEIVDMQDQLNDNIRHTVLMLKKYKLPVISEAGAAIFFVAVSLPKLGHNIVKKMLDAGFYVNLGVFPTVPMKQTGIRFTITRLHTFREIETMIATLAGVFPKAMQEEGITLNEIYKAFKKPLPAALLPDKTADDGIAQMHSLNLAHCKTIRAIDKTAWNNIFANQGTFDWDNLAILENSFSNNARSEDNWEFDYVFVKDQDENIIVATFLTTGTWKDDMLSAKEVSTQVEAKRKNDPYYLTSKVICSGSLITEGTHLYINQSSPLWINALQLFFEKVYCLQDFYKANQIVLRDFHGIDEALDILMVDNGFIRIKMPETNIIKTLGWNTAQEFYQTLSDNGRNQLRKKVLRNEAQFKVNFISKDVPQKELESWYRLYLNVKNKNLELNTFALPFKFFHALINNKNWEVIKLSLPEIKTDPCCVVFCYKAAENYIPMVIGLDYTLNHSFNVYRQALYQVMLRAKQLGKQKVNLGFSANLEKQKLGAQSIPVFAYIHATDSYNLEALAAIPAVKSPI